MTYQTFDFRRSYGTLRAASAESTEPVTILTFMGVTKGDYFIERLEGFDLRAMRKTARQSLRRTSRVSKRLGTITALHITVFDSASDAVQSGPHATLFPVKHSKSAKRATKSRKASAGTSRRSRSL